VVAPPPALRPYLRFAKQTPKSLAAIARVVDDDAEFRARVVDGVDEDQLGRAGWLWLARPDGWEDELAALEAESDARAAAANEQREDRAAVRKLAAAQAALARAESEAAEHLAQLDVVRADLAEARAAGLAAASRVADLEIAVGDLTADRAAIVRKLKDVEARMVERATEVNALKARARELEAELREARSAVAGATVPSEASEAPEPDTPRSVDAATVAREIARAAGGARAVADALGALAGLLGDGNETSPPPSAGAAPPPPPTGGANTPDGPMAVSSVRRVPVVLPGGVFDDSVEAAEHLLRTSGAVLVVDGYNVTMAGWPELPAAEQRPRLLAALSDLAHRTATAVELVFDGAVVDPLSVPAPVRRLVRVRFSPPDVEADDVIIDLVGRIPATTPVIVASSDNRVRAGARRAGANLLHARQLLAVLGR
jgi:predicted RNA-binding protein with PIN domain